MGICVHYTITPTKKQQGRAVPPRTTTKIHASNFLPINRSRKGTPKPASHQSNQRAPPARPANMTILLRFITDKGSKPPILPLDGFDNYTYRKHKPLFLLFTLSTGKSPHKYPHKHTQTTPKIINHHSKKVNHPAIQPL